MTLTAFDKQSNACRMPVESKSNRRCNHRIIIYIMVNRSFRSVADSLKLGSSVMPELYKEASVYFSDIVSFTTLASESTPMEVVDFLNDLWTVFDDIINKFNVYKVRDCHFFVLNGQLQNIFQYILKTSPERFELQIVTTTHRRRNGFEVDGHKVRRKF